MLLVMMVTVALLALGVVFAMRLQVDASGTRAQQERLAALWLGRSALTSGVTGTSTVKLPLGAAVVQVSTKGDSKVAVVTMNGSRATVTSARGAWEERFERAP
jgi:nicotinic acid phosphoribosyltransferase